MDIEYTLDRKIDRNRWQECTIPISLPYIVKIDSFVGNYVLDINNIYLNHNNGIKIWKKIYFQKTFVYHLLQNMDATNKFDLNCIKQCNLANTSNTYGA